MLVNVPWRPVLLQQPGVRHARHSAPQHSTGRCTARNTDGTAQRTLHCHPGTHTIAPWPSPAPCSPAKSSRLKAVRRERVAGVSGHSCRSVSAAPQRKQGGGSDHLRRWR